MSDDEAIDGALVPAPQIRYEDGQRVVFVRLTVERADGSAKEYEARDPENFQMNDPESLSGMVLRTTGFTRAGGSRTMQAAVPSLSLSFSANPRHNLHIHNRRKGDRASLDA